MNFRRNANTLSPIGLDLCGQDVTLAQLVSTPRGWRLLAAARLSRPQGAPGVDDALVARIREVIVRQGFCGTDVAACLPSLKVHVDLLELPPKASGAPIDQLAAAEMARLAGCEDAPLQVASWDVPPPPRGGAGTSLMAVAAKNADAAEYLDPLIRGGLMPVSLEADALANARAAPSSPPNEITAVLDLGWSSASVVFGAAGVPVHHRVLPDHDLARLVRLVAEELQIDPSEAACVLRSGRDDAAGGRVGDEDGVGRLVAAYLESVASEVESSIAFAGHRFPDRPVTRLLLSGPGASLDGAAEWCGGRFEAITATQVLRPSDVAECSSHSDAIGDDPAMVRAIGLAIGAAGTRTTGSASADLMPMVRREALARSRRNRRWAAGIGAQTLLLAALWVSVRLVCGDGPDAARAAADAADADARQMKTSIDRSHAELRHARATLDAISDRADWSILLAIVSRSVGDEVVLNKVNLKPAAARPTVAPPASASRQAGAAATDYGLDLRGAANSQAGVSQFLRRLQAIPVFEDVTLVRTGRDGLGETGRVSFEIRIALYERGGTRS